MPWLEARIFADLLRKITKQVKLLEVAESFSRASPWATATHVWLRDMAYWSGLRPAEIEIVIIHNMYRQIGPTAFSRAALLRH
jgi:hypothetical protein